MCLGSGDSTFTWEPKFDLWHYIVHRALSCGKYPSRPASTIRHNQHQITRHKIWTIMPTQTVWTKLSQRTTAGPPIPPQESHLAMLRAYSGQCSGFTFVFLLLDHSWQAPGDPMEHQVLNPDLCHAKQMTYPLHYTVLPPQHFSFLFSHHVVKFS